MSQIKLFNPSFGCLMFILQVVLAMKERYNSSKS